MECPYIFRNHLHCGFKLGTGAPPWQAHGMHPEGSCATTVQQFGSWKPGNQNRCCLQHMAQQQLTEERCMAHKSVWCVLPIFSTNAPILFVFSHGDLWCLIQTWKPAIAAGFWKHGTSGWMCMDKHLWPTSQGSLLWETQLQSCLVTPGQNLLGSNPNIQRKKRSQYDFLMASHTNKFMLQHSAEESTQIFFISVTCK
jgi:hypothetical protein